MMVPEKLIPIPFSLIALVFVLMMGGLKPLQASSDIPDLSNTAESLKVLTLPKTPASHLRRLSGTFIQYQSWMMQLDSKKWLSELEAMRQAGVDTIVLQWLKSDQTRFYPVNVPGNDPTEIILKYADQNRMKVYLGLQFDKSWWTHWTDGDYLQKTAKKCVGFGKILLKRYQKHGSFRGWYIPYEMAEGDFEVDEVKNFNYFLKTITQGLKSLTRQKYAVGLSTFFHGKIPPAVTQKLYQEILAKSGIDILMIQDGVGVHNWNLQMAEKVLPTLEAFRAAAQKNGIEVWSVVENFVNIKDNPVKSSSGGILERAPTDIGRLKEQLELHVAHPEGKIVTFDFFHYMSPYRGVEQKLLFENYLSQL